MPTLFQCVKQHYHPLNPCNYLMSNAYLRAANLFCQMQYTDDNKADLPWVCNCNCKSVAYKAPKC